MGLLGIANKRQLLSEVATYREYLDWSLYYRDHPWGERRADLRTQALVLWLKSTAEFSDIDGLPDLQFPYFQERDKRAEIAAVSKRAQELRESGNVAGETRDCPDGGHEPTEAGLRPGDESGAPV